MTPAITGTAVSEIVRKEDAIRSAVLRYISVPRTYGISLPAALRLRFQHNTNDQQHVRLLNRRRSLTLVITPSSALRVWCLKESLQSSMYLAVNFVWINASSAPMMHLSSMGLLMSTNWVCAATSSKPWLFTQESTRCIFRLSSTSAWSTVNATIIFIMPSA